MMGKLHSQHICWEMENSQEWLISQITTGRHISGESQWEVMGYEIKSGKFKDLCLGKNDTKK